MRRKNITNEENVLPPFPKEFYNLRKILLFGNYGVKNIGDDLMLHVINSVARECGILIYLPTRNPNNIKIKNSNILSFRYLNVFKMIYSFICSNAIVIGGGNAFKYNILTIQIALFLSYIFMLFKKPIYFYGVGFSQDSGGLVRIFSMKLANRCKSIYVRDNFSQSFFLKECNSKDVNRIKDLVFFYNFENNNIIKEKSIGFALACQSQDKTSINVIINVLISLVNRNKQIHLLAFCPDDYKFNQKIISNLNVRSIYNIPLYLKNPQEILDNIKRFSVFIGMKYHSLVLSHLAGNLRLCISYDTKCREFAKEYGYKWIEISDITTEKILEEIKLEVNNN